MEEITLRSATDDDLNFLYALHRAALREYVEKTWGWDEVFQKAHFEKQFSSETQQIIVAGNTNIGSVSVADRINHTLLARIEILPEYQNRGIGTFLIKNIVRQAESENKPVFLQVIKVNRRAKVLYERLGFSVCGETETHFQMEYNQKQ
jgi:ribosomal protein S18 acetylase RimI-like enzyme